MLCTELRVPLLCRPDHFLWCAAAEGFVLQLCFHLYHLVLDFTLIALEANALSFSIELLVMEKTQIHTGADRANATGIRGERLLCEVEGLQAGQTQNAFLMKPEQLDDPKVFAGDLGAGLLGLQPHLGFCVSDGNNQVLNQLELIFAHGICHALAYQAKSSERQGPIATGAGELVPQFLGDERHEWMQQVEGGFEGTRQINPGRRRPEAIHGARYLGLQPLHVPIAELMPEEMVNCERRFVEPVLGQSLIYFPRRRQQTRKNPSVS